MKKLTKKIKNKLNIEDEIQGVAVSLPKKPEKRLDLTKEISNFLNNPISLESIKRIIILADWRDTEEMIKKAKIKVVGLHKNSRDKVEKFFIIIEQQKRFEDTFFLTSFGLYKCGWMGVEDMATSNLKNELVLKIFNWLSENLDKCVIIK